MAGDAKLLQRPLYASATEGHHNPVVSARLCMQPIVGALGSIELHSPDGVAGSAPYADHTHTNSIHDGTRHPHDVTKTHCMGRPPRRTARPLRGPIQAGTAHRPYTPTSHEPIDVRDISVPRDLRPPSSYNHPRRSPPHTRQTEALVANLVGNATGTHCPAAQGGPAPATHASDPSATSSRPRSYNRAVLARPVVPSFPTLTTTLPKISRVSPCAHSRRPCNKGSSPASGDANPFSIPDSRKRRRTRNLAWDRGFRTANPPAASITPKPQRHSPQGPF